MDIFILFINGIGGYNQNIEDELDKYVCIKLRSIIHPKISQHKHSDFRWKLRLKLKRSKECVFKDSRDQNCCIVYPVKPKKNDTA